MKLLYEGFEGGRVGFGLLILRVITGLAMMQHGWPKILNPLDWMAGRPGAAPPFLQAMAALAEFGGGACLVLGLLTPLAALGIAITMAVAITTRHWEHPWVAIAPYRGPTKELALNYLTIAVMLLVTGPGAYALDAWLFGRRGGRK